MVMMWRRAACVALCSYREDAGRSRGADPGGRADRPARVPWAGRPQVHACRDGRAVRGPVRAAHFRTRSASGRRVRNLLHQKANMFW